jgi:hypothetical protein
MENCTPISVILLKIEDVRSFRNKLRKRMKQAQSTIQR